MSDMMKGITPPKLTIHQRMIAAMKDIGSIGEDAKNTHQNYKYLSHTAVKAAVHKALITHGIVFTLSGESHEYIPLEKGGMSNMGFTFRFWNADDKTDFIEGTWHSSAADFSDKSHTKAITFAIREILKSNFMIATDDADPDGDTPEVQHRPAHTPTKYDSEAMTEPQRAKILSLAKAKGVMLSLDNVEALTKREASAEIERLIKAPTEPTEAPELDLDDIPF